jgi:hypothetical protein
MMLRIGWPAVALAFLGLGCSGRGGEDGGAAAAASVRWQEVPAAAGHFRVLMPEGARAGTFTTPGRKEAVTGYSVGTPDAAYYAWSAEVSPQAPPNAAKEIRRRVTGGGRLLWQKDFSLAGHTGKEFEMKTPGKEKTDHPPRYVLGRVLVTGERAYRWEVLSDESRARDPDARKFLDSFRITPP